MSTSNESEILVEYNGKTVQYTKDQLIAAASGGQIPPNAVVRIGSHSCFARQLPWFNFPNASPQMPALLTTDQPVQSNQYPPPEQYLQPDQYQQPPYTQPNQYQQPQYSQPNQYQQPPYSQYNQYQQPQYTHQNQYQQPVQVQVFPVGKFCPACGNPLVQTAVVCPMCGSVVG